MKVIVQEKFRGRFKQLLEICVSPSIKSLNTYILPTIGQNNIVLHAPTVYFPNQRYHSISTVILNKMRTRFSIYFSKIWTQNHTGIIIYDRLNQKSRSLVQGLELFSALKARYKGQRRVYRFWGNETLLETVKILRSSSVFIGVHGAGLTNLIFMPEKSKIIEISGTEIECFRELSNQLQFQHYQYYCDNKCNHTSVIQVNLAFLLTKIYNVIEKY